MTPTPTAPDGLGVRAAAAFTAYRHGERERLSELVDLVTPVLWNAARAQGGSHAVCEDAVQNAFLQLVDRADGIHEPAAVLGWLVVVVKREVWRVGRGARREVDVDEVPEAPTQQIDPEAHAILDERQRVLWHHIETLTPRCQELIRVIAFADRPDYASIADALGMPVGSIGPTRGRCLQKLRVALGSDPGWAV
ncbi:RNA polymerase sigma factor [Terracoccus luteus]|jgi:RNA polymerase sigma factor (sigma-70 family)|uniref:RNA polymerase sigma factor (Sigma-70 family) n=1 Tax=Terracoccus luteus TaxID=53356 RepID=A0A839PXS3_9MICO|nr:sigma-70 family RNA polymerase sigma factor [Terracoccus luteus]MBB2987524.1 RNA polymerase sigma factor (sigma-70 family) [Terracoccus luteus]MCP2173175.1 RNA polymerase sigma factor (sigma-70 family) [Terracoccus luteus]